MPPEKQHLPDLKRARILVAEDEPFIAFDIVSAVEDAGGEAIGPVASVREAMALIVADGIRAAILDVDLQDGDIGPVIQALQLRGIPLILHSGGGLPPALHHRFRHVEFHRKPTSAGLLVRSIAGCLDRRPANS